MEGGGRNCAAAGFIARFPRVLRGLTGLTVGRIVGSMRRTKRAVGGLGGGTRTVLAGAAFVLVVALVAFHAWLLWVRAADGRLLEPAVAFRWTAGGALVLVIAALRRHRIQLLRGRRALVVWLLVALLHWSAAAPASEAGVVAGSWRMADVLFVLPSSAAPIALVLSVLAAGAARGIGRARPAFVPLGRVPALTVAAPAAGARLLLSSRAPPV